MNDSIAIQNRPGFGGEGPCGESIKISDLISEFEKQHVPPPKLYRIGELIEHSGFSRQTIHNYTAMGLIHESQWTEKGHRLYGADAFRHLALIKYLKPRYSLAQIKEIFAQVLHQTD